MGFLDDVAAFAALQPLAGAVHLIIGVGAAGGAFYSYRFWRMRMLLTNQMEILLGDPAVSLKEWIEKWDDTVATLAISLALLTITVLRLLGLI